MHLFRRLLCSAARCGSALCGRRLEAAPGVEAAGEAVRLVSLADETQFSWVLRVFGAHVLDVNLEGEAGRREGVRRMRKWAESSLSPFNHVYV